MQRPASSVLVLCVLSVAGGCTGGGGSAPTFATPEATFAAAKAAGQKQDWRALCATMTPATVDTMAGGMVVMGSMMDAFSGMAAQLGGEQANAAEMQASLQKIKDVLAKHGVSPEAAPSADMLGQDEPDAEAMKKLVAPIKDRGAFVADMIDAMKGMGGPGGAGGPGQAIADRFGPNVLLTDLKIEGDTATGNISTGDEKQPVRFEKVAGSWLFSEPPGGGGPGGK